MLEEKLNGIRKSIDMSIPKINPTREPSDLSRIMSFDRKCDPLSTSNITQAKSNYMNYSQFKKNEQSVLLYGNDSRSGTNSFVLNSSSYYNNDYTRVPQVSKAQLTHNKPDFSQIVMEGRRVVNPHLIHPCSLKDNRKHKSHHRCQ